MNEVKVENNIGIRNCMFAYRCSKKWNTLVKTEVNSVRYCDECDRGVHLCKTDKEITNAINKDWCVAVVTFNELNEEDEQNIWPIGDIIELK